MQKIYVQGERFNKNEVKMDFSIIGISDKEDVFFSPDIIKVISDNKIFSGGKRHKQLVLNYLPKDYVWIDITIPLSKVFNEYKTHESICVFASGDPLFYGIANTIKRELPESEISVYPYFNSIQLLAHKLVMPYQDIRYVSLTGRPYYKLDESLINGENLIGVLTDKNNTPKTVAERLLYYGYSNYKIHVGENLGNIQEKISTYSLEEAKDIDFSKLNCLILEKIGDRHKYLGIPESEFHILEGRPKMLTKMPIRLLSLSLLNLNSKTVFWDIGFCTGSVSIEAKLQFPHLKIYSFEIRKESESIMENNCKKFGTPGIEYFIGDFLEQDIEDLEMPDAVFIGGHGGKLHNIVEKISNLLKTGGTLVFNSVSKDSKEKFISAITTNNMKLSNSINLKVDDNNPIDVLVAHKL